MQAEFNLAVEAALSALRRGEVILYPTDIGWAIGCEATNEEAVSKILGMVEGLGGENFTLLVAGERDLLHYVAAPDPAVFDFLQEQAVATTVIFNDAIHLPASLLAADGSIALRIVQDEFCRHLIKRLRKPVVATPAGSAGQLPAFCLGQVDDAIKQRVDHVVAWRQAETIAAKASQLIRWRKGIPEIIR